MMRSLRGLAPLLILIALSALAIWATAQNAPGAPPTHPQTPAPPAAHPTPVAFTLPDTRIESLHSTANGIDYKLYVALPPGFDAGGGADRNDSNYPLLVLLDADYSFPIAHAIAAHLRERNDLPALVVVGIAYAGPPAYRLNRTRDYTPTHVPDGGYGADIQRHSGGGPAFADFIERELLPHLRARYRTTGKRVLVGHSYGGLFGAWALLERPDLFDGYILASPSLWYDTHLPLRLEAALPAPRRAFAARVYAATGALEVNAERDMPEDLRRFAARLSRERYPNLELRAEILDDETHNSVFPRALSNGLRYHWSRGSF